MNNKIRHLILFFISISCSLSPKAQNTLLKLSINDCKNCSLILENILNNSPKIPIVLKSEYESDSIDILNKFNISRYKKNIIWSDSLYSSFSNSDFSEIIILRNDTIKFRQELRNLDLKEYERNIQLEGAKYCGLKLPKSFSIINNTNSIHIINLVTEKNYILNAKTLSIDTFKFNESNLKEIFFNHFGIRWKQELDNYKVMYTEHTQTLPSISALFLLNDSIAFATIITYSLQVNKHDSQAVKMFSIIKYNNTKVQSIFKLDLGHKYNYGFDEYSLFGTNDYLYIACMHESDSSKDKKVIAEFRLNKNTYELNKILDFQLPENYIKNGYNYNMIKCIYHNEYVTFPLSNFIIDVRSNKKIYIPFDKHFFDKNDNLLNQNSFKLNFAIWDLKHNNSKNEFSLIYNLDDYFYVAKFKDGDFKFISNTKWKHYQDSEITPALSNDSKYIIYKEKNLNCLKYDLIP